LETHEMDILMTELASIVAYGGVSMILRLAILVALSSSLDALEWRAADGTRREFDFDGKVWRTTGFTDPAGQALPVASDEFHRRWSGFPIRVAGWHGAAGECAREGGGDL
jgi:hypothetical protein